MFQSFAFMSRRDFIAAAAMAAAGIVCSSPRGVFAAEPEKRSVTIAVGGKNLYYYLPMALADWMGFYKDEGLDVKVVDFQGGSKSLQAVVGGSADVVSERLSTRFRCRPSASPCRPLCFRIVRRSAFLPLTAAP